MVTAIKILCILALKVPPHCLEITRNVSFEFLALAFSANFCRIKINLSGNTVWPQASGFQNWPFLTFLMNFCPCKRSSLRSHCWMRLFLWFSNTVDLSALPDNLWKIVFFRCNTFFCYLCGAKLPAQNPYGHFSEFGDCYQQLFEGVDNLDEEFFFVDSDEESEEDDFPIFNL